MKQQEAEILQDFAQKLIGSQVDLPEEFNDVVNEHSWDLVDNCVKAQNRYCTCKKCRESHRVA